MKGSFYATYPDQSLGRDPYYRTEKNEMIEISNIVAEIEAGPQAKKKLLPYTWCMIDEVPPAKWGIGGNPLRLDILRSLPAD